MTNSLLARLKNGCALAGAAALIHVAGAYLLLTLGFWQYEWLKLIFSSVMVWVPICFFSAALFAPQPLKGE